MSSDPFSMLWRRREPALYYRKPTSGHSTRTRTRNSNSKLELETRTRNSTIILYRGNHDREQWQPMQHSQLRQHGEFRHVSVSERSVITAVWSESSCAFPKNGTATGSRWSARAMATNGETKALISPPPR